jgi:transposase
MNQTKYVGLDVHKASISIAVLDSQGKLLSQAVIKTEASTILDFFKGLTGAVHLTFEEGTHAQWLFELLQPLVAKLVVCDPTHNKLLLSGNKTDRQDAHKLATLLRGNLLKSVFHSTLSSQALKERVRLYENLTEDSTRVSNRIKAIFRSRGIACSGRLPYQLAHRDDWLAKIAEAGARARLALLYEERDFLKELRRRAKLQMIKEARLHRAFKVLMNVPTLGPIRVAQIIATIASPHRFRTKRQFWSYCGLAVVTRSSADYQFEGDSLKKKAKVAQTRGLNRNFNHRLKQVFKSAALDAIKRGEFKAYYEKQKAQGLKAELARVQLARKIAAIALSIFKSGEEFDQQRLSVSA